MSTTICRPRQSAAVLTLLGLLFGATFVHGQPVPSEVLGGFEGDAVLRIVGTDFGQAGPDIVLFEDFESGSMGALVPKSGPPIGRWTRNDGARIVDQPRTGGGAMATFEDGRGRIVGIELPEKHREIFLSYWVRVPPGTRFPGDTSGSGEFSTDSSWKLAWLMDTTEGYRHDNGRYDIVLPTWTGSNFQLAGNSYHPGDRYLSEAWWSWNHWMRISVWIQDPLQVPARDYLKFEAVSRDRGHYQKSVNAASDRVAYAAHRFDVLNFPGWIRSGGSNVAPVYDDIYVAVGDGAAARVELANASRYERATRVELLLAETWTPYAIEARMPRAVQLDEEELWFLFVTRSDGQRNAEGLSLCTVCPQPPHPRLD